MLGSSVATFAAFSVKHPGRIERALHKQHVASMLTLQAILILLSVCSVFAHWSGFYHRSSLEHESQQLWKTIPDDAQVATKFSVNVRTHLSQKQSGHMPPIEWREKIQRVEMLYASPEPSVCFMPEVGNGYLATPVSSSIVRISIFRPF